jgi:hypothetical protein
MKIVLVTTTIHVPMVLSAYRDAGPDVAFIVAGDHKSPHESIRDLMSDLGDARYLHPDEQTRWKCSDPLGWNTIARRNIALLEAIALKPDIIVSIDDDNIPLTPGFFADIVNAFERRHAPEVRSGNSRHGPSFFNAGQFLVPPVRMRGLPRHRFVLASDSPILPFVYGPSSPLRVGVVQGMALGDPDIDAVDRLASRPTVLSAADVLHGGVVLEPVHGFWTVFNTQATAFLTELAPAMFCPPHVGRHDDIVASMITQLVMRERGFFVHFGRPLVWQARNVHDLLKDLRDEEWGYDHIGELAVHLDDLDFTREDLTPRDIWESFRDLSFFPAKAIDAALAFLDDVASLA